MNTAIAAMMTMVNEFYANGCSKGDVEMLCLLLSPFAPHMVEEMWENMGFAAKYGKMAMQMDWPEHDEAKTVDSHVAVSYTHLDVYKRQPYRRPRHGTWMWCCATPPDGYTTNRT